MSDFRPYPAYKDSGVEWLGEVPEGWEVRPFRYSCRIAESLVDPTLPAFGKRVLVAPNHIEAATGRLLLQETAAEQGALSGKYLAPKGDVIYSKIRPALNKVVVSQGDWMCSADMYPIRPVAALQPEFLKLWMLSGPFVHLAVDASMRVAMPKVNRDTLGGFPVLIPPLSEQRTIAAFLDRETARIDELIAKKERFLELLDEKRTALITQAVTKGLDPNAMMKDSGIDWLGEIPEGWEVRRVKRLYARSKRQGHEDETVLSVYRDYGVVEKSSRDDNINKTPEDLSTYQLVEPHDLVINKMKAWQGSLGVAPTRGITSPDYLVYSPANREEPRYLHYLLRCRVLAAVYKTISNGIRPAQWRLEAARFGNLDIPLPPLSEQRAIADHLDRETAKLDALKSKVTHAIALLREYRAALISAAVTGKIDVRDEVAA